MWAPAADRKYRTRPQAAAVPSAGTAKPATSPSEPAASRQPSRTIHDTGTPSVSAASATDLLWVKFKT